MRERVSLQQPVRTPDGAGGADVSWSSAVTVWAKVETPGGTETAMSERLAARTRHRLTIRYRSGVTAQMRALWRGRTLDIRAVRDADGRRRFLILDCEEGTA